jgi:hypothetical protein
MFVLIHHRIGIERCIYGRESWTERGVLEISVASDPEALRGAIWSQARLLDVGAEAG